MTDFPSDHIGNSDGLDPPLGGELQVAARRCIEAHHQARRRLDEDLAARVPVNNHPATLVKDGEIRIRAHELSHNVLLFRFEMYHRATMTRLLI